MSQTISVEKGTEGFLEIFGVALDRAEHCGDSTFDRKEAVIMVFTSQTSPETLAKISKLLGVQKTLGSVTLLKGIEPEPPDWEAPHISGPPPIQAEAWVDDKTFQAIITQLANADIRQVVVSLTLRFGGPNLPSQCASDAESLGVPLGLLDVRKTRTYALLELNCAANERDWFSSRKPQSPPWYLDAKLPRYSVSMHLVEASVAFDFDLHRIERFEATFVAREFGSPINGSLVQVNWEEFEHEGASNDYADLADAGTFDARALKGAPGPPDCLLYMYLRYTQRQAHEILLPVLINRPQNLGVELRATLLADRATMWEQPDGLVGRIRRYALHLFRPRD